MRQLVTKFWRLVSRMTSETSPTPIVSSLKHSLDDDAANSEVIDKKRRLEPQTPVDRSKRRLKYAMLLSYSGTNYYGMQIQFGKQANVTVESKLFDAMLKTGLITPELAKKPIDFHFQRAARTDRAVSAVRQCCSMWLEMDKDANIDALPARINAEMPDDIRVIGVKRATKGFHCQKNCDSRTYSYTLPTFAFAPCIENTKSTYRLPEERLAEVNKLLEIFLGTHNFFNYTARREYKDKSCYRYIMAFECGKPFIFNDDVRGETEFATIQIRGASFMLHQIRKMIGMVIAIMRGFADKSVIQKTWEQARVDVPKAPGLGLMLEKVHYEHYDRKFKNSHAPLDTWVECESAIQEFREKVILANILKTELLENSMMTWLSALLYHSYDDCQPGTNKPFCNAKHQITAEDELKNANADGGDDDDDDPKNGDDEEIATEAVDIDENTERLKTAASGHG